MEAMVEVVAAIIKDPERGLLLCRRPSGKIRGGLWEFPGGKVESGEDLKEALSREIREELGVEINVGRLLGVVDHHYPEGRIRLFGFLTEIRRGIPRSLEGQKLSWVEPEDISSLDLAPADRRLWQAIVESGGLYGP